MALSDRLSLTYDVQYFVPTIITGVLERIPPLIRDQYKSDFYLADQGFFAGRVAQTTKDRNKYWDCWTTYVKPMEVDPYLQNVPFTTTTRAITGFAARVRTGHYGRGRTITAPAVNSAITAVGKTIAMARGVNPTKTFGSDKLLPRLKQMLDGWTEEDPPTVKKLPIEVDIPEYIANTAHQPDTSHNNQAIGDLVLIAFYYLLRVGEYTSKAERAHTKRTIQFKLEDVTFFQKDGSGVLRQLPKNAMEEHLLSAESATLKLDNQKNGWKGVCIHQEANGDTLTCPVRALARRISHIRQHTSDKKTPISAYFHNNVQYQVTDKEIRSSLKDAAEVLQYPELKGIPIERIDTHSLRSGGANALALSGYSDREIQKMGRWRSATFKEYIREELACFSRGMTRNMKRKFGFVNIAGGIYHDVTDTMITTQYNTFAVAA